MIVDDAFIAALSSATLRLSIGALIALLTLRLTRASTPRLHRWVWGAVLVQSLLFAPIKIPLPLLEPAPQRYAAAHAVPNVVSLNAHRTLNDSETVVMAHQTPEIRSTAEFLGILWLMGCGFILFIFATSLLLIQWTIRRSVPARDAWQSQLDQIRQAMGIASPLKLMVSQTSGPLLTRSPRGYCIIVPRQSWHSLTADQREAVLLHELAHFQRGDIWYSLVMRLCASVHWFNPLSWWIVSKFDEAAEWACDGEVRKCDEAAGASLAGALLALGKPSPSVRIGVSMARGSRVSVRVRRLIGQSYKGESVMKRFAVLSVAVGLLVTGLVRFHLVAQEMQGGANAQVDGVAVAGIATHLENSKDPLQQKLAAALRSEPGQIVLRDQIAQVAQEAAAELQGTIVEVVLNEHFMIDEDSATLIDPEDPIRQEMIDAGKSSTEDVQSLSTACKQLADELNGDDEVTRLVQRFLRENAGPDMLYITQLRKQMRPGIEMISEVFRRALAQGADGLYHVRPDARGELQQIVDSGGDITRQTERLRRELKLWASGLLPKDDLHRSAKTAFSDPQFASMLVAEQVFGKKRKLNVNRILEQLDGGVVDTADGLVLHQEAITEVQVILDRFTTLQSRKSGMRNAIDSFRMMISESDPLSAGFKKLLASDVALVAISLSGDVTDAPVSELLRGMLAEVLDDSGNGLRLRTDSENATQLQEHIQKAFRDHRQARRRAAPVRELASKVTDKELSTALESMGGMLVVKRLVEAKVAGLQMQSLETWKNALFESNGDTLQIRDSAREQVEEMLSAIASVEQELENNDF